MGDRTDIDALLIGALYGELSRAEWAWWTARVAGALLIWSWWSSRALLRRR